MRMLITGASGQVGSYLLRAMHESATAVTAWSGRTGGALLGHALVPVDIADEDQVAAAFRAAQPDVIVHAAALASVAVCYSDPDRAHRINVRGTQLLTELAEELRARLVLVSTDLVFDGEHGNYAEDDVPGPLSVYARTKLAAERVVLQARGSAVARVSLLYGPSLTGRLAFFDQQVVALRNQQPVTLFEDEFRTPLDVPTTARALIALALGEFTGIIHVGGAERMSRVEMGRRLARFLGLSDHCIVSTRRANAAAPEPRAADFSLDSRRSQGLFPHIPRPTYEEALAQLPWPHKPI